MQISQVGLAGAMAERARPELDEIFLSHRDLIFRTAYRITGNAGDAEDVLQTVFLRLIRQENPAAITNLAGYLHRSAVNVSLDILRARKDAQVISLDQESTHTPAALIDKAGHTTELRDWLRQALARLNPRWAEMFVLRFVEEFSNREVADIMKTSPAVVAVLLHRTRAQLKKDLKSLTKARKTR